MRLFRPDKITENFGEFLGYFMIRKVAAGQEMLARCRDGDHKAGHLAR